MDAKRLIAIGKEVAKRVQETTGVDEISFNLMRGRQDLAIFTGGGIMSKGGKIESYILNTRTFERLMAMDEMTGRAALQQILEDRAGQVFKKDAASQPVP